MERVRYLARLLAPLLVVSAAFAARVDAQVQLSAPMARPWGRVHQILSSPDGARVVFAAEQEFFGVPELYSAPVDGSSPAVKISGPWSGQPRTLARLCFTPDSSRVVYVLDGVGRLMSAPVDGSAPPVLLASVGCADCDDSDFALAFTPDGTHLLYRDERYDQHPLYAVPVDGSASAVAISAPDAYFVRFFAGSADGRTVVFEDVYGLLWSRPIDASTPAVRLDAGLLSYGPAPDPLLTPDGKAVFLAVDELLLDGLRLYVAPLDGSMPPRDLSGPSMSLAEVDSLVLDGSATRVVYRADFLVDGRQELFVVPLDGSAPPRVLSGPLVSGGNVQTFVLADGGTRVVYRADARVDGQDELYEAPLDGSRAPRRLSHVLAPGAGVLEFALTADGAMAVYRSAEAGVGTLWSARVDEPWRALRLNGPLVAGGSVTSFALAEPPGGARRVVYRADADVDELFELYSAQLPVPRRHLLPVGVPRVTRLHAPALAGWQVATDQEHVLHATDADGNGTLEQRSVPVRGGAVVRLDQEPGPGGSAATVCFTTPTPGRLITSQRVDYRTDVSLFSVPLAGGASVRLNAPQARGPEQGAVRNYASTSDGANVVYVADQEHLGHHDLYVVPSLGSAAPRKLHDAGAWSSQTLDFVLSADGTRVLHRADPDFDARHELFVASLDGTEPPRALGSGAGVLGGYVLAPDDEEAVFLRDDADGTALFRVPLDASAAPTRLCGSLVPGGDVEAFSLAPDATRVVFRADAELDGRSELWSSPLDGGARARLSPALASNRDVRAFLVTPDSARVVFQSDARIDEQFELYSVPLAGGPVLELDPAAAGSGSVQAFRLTPDGRYVVFVARSGTSKLWRVPVDGSAAPLRLDGPLVAGGSVRSDGGPWIAPAIGRVLYLADQAALYQVELWSAPLDGSAPAVRVNDPLGAGASGLALAFLPDGKQVVYLENPSGGRPRTLTRARSAGGGPHLALSAIDAAAGEFCLDPNGLRALYLATPLPYGEPQLFLAWTDAGSAPRRLDVDSVPYHRVTDLRFTPDGRFALWLDTIPGAYGVGDVVHLWSRRLPLHLRPAPVPPLLPRRGPG